MRRDQLPANLPLQRLQHPHIRLRIQAPHPPPISGKSHIREPASIHPTLNHYHPDIDKLILHRVRHIPQQKKLKLFPVCHRCSTLCSPVSSAFKVLSLFPPPRKRPPRRYSKCLNQLPHHPASRNQSSHQLLQLIPLPSIPLWRNLSSQRPHHISIHLLDPRKPWLKRLPPAHALIHFVPRINSAQRIIRKCPLPGIKTISLIDKRRRVLPLPQLSPERRLPAVRVPRPLVHHQHPRECFQIPHQPEHFRRKIIEYLSFQRTHRILRPKLQSRFAPDHIVRQLHVQFRRMLHQPGTHLHHFSQRNRQPGPLRQPRRQHFVRQDPQVLGIVPKLHHIEVSIRAAHQMSLRSPSHPSHVLDRFHQSRSAARPPHLQKDRAICRTARFDILPQLSSIPM